MAPPILLLLALLLEPGPAQTISGKFVPGPPPPLAGERPADVDGLCDLIEGGHGGADLFAALGDALLARGDRALAYRAFDKAHRLGFPDRARIQARKDLALFVPEATIRAEEREAAIWRDALDSYTRARGPEYGPFYEKYGRPEESLDAVVRAWRISWAGGVLGLLLGAAFCVGMRRLPRRASAIAFAVALLGAVGGLVLSRSGLLPLGAAASAVGGLLVLVSGRAGR